MTDFDIICVGDVTVDAFLQIHGANEKCRLSDNSELCIRYGDKITVDKCDFLLGGNACNVSVGISRMGFKSSLVAEIGDDEFSQKITNGLSKEKVDISHVLKKQNTASSFAIGLNFKGERTLFVEHVQRKHDFSFEEMTSKWVYLTSLGKEWKEAYKNTLDFVKKNNIRLAFNPGSIQLTELDEMILEVLRVTDILFVNKEEAIRIFNFQSFGKLRTSFSIFQKNGDNKDIKTILINLQSLGPKRVVITDGRNGSYLIDESGKIFFLDMFPGEPVERTGAGDGYTSGFLSAILSGLPASEAMRWGTINGASVVLQVGAQPGLLSKEEIQEKLKEHSGFREKEI